MEQSPDGAYVHTSSYERLLSHIDQLQQQLEGVRGDAERLTYLQACLDKPAHETIFSVYEYGTRVFALRNALDKRAAIDAARFWGEKS
jgi:hypothetical protein